MASAITGGRLQIKILRGRAIRKETGALRRQHDRQLYVIATQGPFGHPQSKTQRIELANLQNSGEDQKWDRSVEFIISQPITPITLALYETENFGHDTFLGLAYVHLYSLRNQEPLMKWLPLCDAKSYVLSFVFSIDSSKKKY